MSFKHMPAIEFYRRINAVEVWRRDKNAPPQPESHVRLYCESAARRWNLQIRAPMKRLDGTTSARWHMIANAHMSPEDMRALRDSINEHLREYGLEDGPTERSTTEEGTPK